MSTTFIRGRCPRCLLPSTFSDGHIDPFACIASLKKELGAHSTSYAAILSEVAEAIKAKERIVFETIDGGSV